jgi:hypothetical protein
MAYSTTELSNASFDVEQDDEKSVRKNRTIKSLQLTISKFLGISKNYNQPIHL